MKKLIKLIKKLFNPELLRDFEAGLGETYTTGGCWGDFIGWSKPNESIHGWKRRIPVEGDWLLSLMTSGKTGVFRIKNVKPCKDPRDMFFADTEFVGYKEDCHV
jgi:hypothetical protein